MYVLKAGINIWCHLKSLLAWQKKSSFLGLNSCFQIGLHQLELCWGMSFESLKIQTFWFWQKVICGVGDKLSSGNDNRKPSSSDFQNLISAKCCSNEEIYFWNFLNFKSEMMDEFWIVKNSNILMAKTPKSHLCRQAV